MQVSLNWLNEFVDLSNVEASQIAHELTMSGLEVEAVEDVKPSFTNIKTVKIEKIDAHPNSDRLHLVTVNTGSGLKTVVCGAQNIAEGQVVPYASVGSQVLDRKTGEMFTLTPAVIRGVESQGMLCSADELGVSDRNYQEEDGILILNRIFSDVIEILVKEISRLDKKFGIKLDEINIGGGLGVKYTEKDVPPSTYEIGEIIINKLNEVIEKYNIESPTLFLEPGRSIISTSGVTLYSIGSSKQVPHGTKYVAVDGGMADNPRPSMYQAEYFAQIANKKENAQLEKVTVAGRYCESGDILIKDIELPNPVEGDILCVYNTGAYNYSMASNYNRVQKPAMVLVNNSQSDIIINRENLDDLISHDIIPDRLK